MATAAEMKPARESLPAGTVLCDHCTAKCCRYFALPIETPSTQEEFEYLRWYVMHGDTTIFCEDGAWYLMVHNKCDHLQDDHRCGIYHQRPQICREYETKDCEYEDNWTYERYWELAEQIGEYAEAVLPRKKGQSIRSPKPPLLPVL
jgi:Fe-S-cluster containining protein